MDFGTILVALCYPFIAAWLVGIGRNRRMAELEDEIAALRDKISAFSIRDSDQRRPADADWLRQPQASVPASAPISPVAQQTQTMVRAVESDAVASPFEPTKSAADPAHDVTPVVAASNTPQTPPDLSGRSQESRMSQNAVDGGGAALPPKPRLPAWASAALGWLFTGNLVAKLGLVILFIGVGFLLKYVAETVVIPIELRLVAVVAGTLALLGWGWRMRGTRREIGLPVQGTAIAILMLVVFGAYHRYALIPAGFAFAILITLTAFTCLLAVLQDSPWLAAFGISGGFVSPILLSTGSGQHVVLFSYYALLNAGVFMLSFKRAWRALNLLGFGFTFVVGTTWGGLHYTAVDYPSAQGFLILFFLLYVGIALGFARQQQTRLKDYVDAILVLGTPLLAFGLQTGLVKDKAFGLALSALALGGFYLTLAMVLWRRGRERWRVLAETFTALGVIFGTLAIPFAVDGRWTSGVWALEGAGFVWVGLRRQHRMTWMFGVLLQAGAWMGFLGAATGMDPEGARTSNLWLGFLLLAGSAFAMARGFRRHAADEQLPLSTIANWCLVMAAAWLLAGAWTEAILQTSGGLLANLLAAGALLTAGLLYLSAARLAWPLAQQLAMAAQVAGALALLIASAAEGRSMEVGGEPLIGVVMIAVAALATSRLGERMPDEQINRWFPVAFLLWGGAWWFGPTMAIGAGRVLDFIPAAFGTVDVRWTAAYSVAVAASAVVFVHLGAMLNWRGLRGLAAVSWGLLPVITVAVLATLYGTYSLPASGLWLAWAALWVSGEYVLLRRTAEAVPLNGVILRCVHVVRIAGPWLALWPAGAIMVDRWLRGADADAETGWALSAAWSNYLPTWAMMLVLAWLLGRSRSGAWPTGSLAAWYRTTLIPGGALLILSLAAVWNLVQDGSMAPLPYLPLLNPLDLTTGFALVMVLGAIRTLAPAQTGQNTLLRRLRIGGIVMAYAWFNLILLRSAAHYCAIPYRIEELAASQFVQAMLSLVWCASALVLMRFAARKMMRRSWCAGAVLLGIVVLKLFTFDLANTGSLERVVSFVSVGLLMLLVGYFAPFPKTVKDSAPATSGT